MRAPAWLSLMTNTLQLCSAPTLVVSGGDAASACKCGVAPMRNPVIGRQKNSVGVAGRLIPPELGSTGSCKVKKQNVNEE